ncbi:PREDICTED: B3 domain-containing transcription factor VRN1-like isoform X2 [Nelumbo nucifera]|uniref:TF-B3 domain-containing protein n=2 Tax=Nelumbo nucifera TaxID=4432 RepID=A0A822ZVH3_NELNU|nr:PREDICTED: B3 domain-containing transcription factor VRN1-like isoform X2 [Nelumbo nucifera]DAD46876.1 TPA_asm: hypothetical protein HUJ06_016813 [Nelumbo nucifera]
MNRRRSCQDSSDVSSISWVKSFHFFKIIHSSILQQRQLVIPEKFVRKLRGNLSTVAVLTVPSGKVWRIGLKKVNGKLWFQKGWQEFVEYHSLGEGHVLVFRYEGNSHFHVLIFDTTASEIEYPCDHTENHLETSLIPCKVKEEILQEDSLEILDVFPPSLGNPASLATPSSKGVIKERLEDQCTTRGRRENHPRWSRKSEPSCGTKNHGNGNPHPQASSTPSVGHKETEKKSAITSGTKRRPDSRAFATRGLTIQERSRVGKAARAFKSKNPFVSVIMRPSYVGGGGRGCSLDLPMEFCRIYLTEEMQRNIKMEDSDGRSWSARLFFEGNGAVRICKGWRKFVRENHLKLGDICIFELVERNPVKLKIVIFRMAEN